MTDSECNARRKMPGPRNRAKPLRLYALAEHPSPTNRQVRSLARIDGRTRAGRIAKRFREELIEFVGGEPDVIQSAMIQNCVFMQLRIELMNQRIAENRYTEYDSKIHYAAVGALNRSLLKLGYRENVEILRKKAEAQLAKAYGR